MITAKDAVAVYRVFSSHRMNVWLTGGWGIDALLHRQTRQHKDIDILMMLQDVEHMVELFARKNYRVKEIWSENKWVAGPGTVRIPTAFVLGDLRKREIDAHAITVDAAGRGIPSWNNDEGWIFDKEALSGKGIISGVAVQCLSPKTQAKIHTGYALPVHQIQDMKLLSEKFGDAQSESA